MTRKGILIVISGFSGAGKGTLMKALLEQHDNYALSISATTRQPRAGELDGREYFFLSRERFEAMIEQGDFIEYADYVGNYYGTPKTYVDQQLEEGKDVILEIEIQGALNIKARFPDTVLLFVSPPSAEELRRRLIGRGTESLEVIESRLARAAEESRGMEAYDYFVINDDLEECVESIHQILQAEHRRASRNLEAIEQIRKEISYFSRK